MKGKIKRIASLLTAMLLWAAFLGNLSAAAAAGEMTANEELYYSGGSLSEMTAVQEAAPAGPVIDKDVGEIGRNSASFDVGEVHTWIIRTAVPADLDGAERFTITETVDYRLTYQPESLTVKLHLKNGSELTLEPGKHYTLMVGRLSAQNQNAGQIVVDLTEEGRAYAAKVLNSGGEMPELWVFYCAAINAHAAMGETIFSQAQLDYISESGVQYSVSSDKPEVHTAGISLRKTDAGGAALPGATFRVGYPATEAELSDETVHKEILSLEEEDLTVVFVDFYDNKALLGEKVQQVTTDENGDAVLYGLAYGTYYLVETEAPAGYNLLTQPIAVILDGASHLTEAEGWRNSEGVLVDNTVYVVNTRFVLPQTGGIGTGIFTVAGLALMATAGLLLLMNRKRAIW